MACVVVVSERSQEAYGDTQMIRRLMDDREVVMYVDLHGHSRKKNIFMYGCENKGNWHLALHERVFPRMLWRNGTTFSYADCNFKVQKAKESTARVVVWRELGLTNRCGCRTPAVPAVHRNVSLWRAFPLCHSQLHARGVVCRRGFWEYERIALHEAGVYGDGACVLRHDPRLL